MIKLATLLLVILVSLPVGATAQIDNYTPYHALLAKQCSARHLEWVSPGDLNELIAEFHRSLRPAQQRRLDAVNEEKTACADVTMGATCGNVAALRAMTTMGLLADFAKRVCASGMICRGQSNCSKTLGQNVRSDARDKLT